MLNAYWHLRLFHSYQLRYCFWRYRVLNAYWHLRLFHSQEKERSLSHPCAQRLLASKIISLGKGSTKLLIKSCAQRLLASKIISLVMLWSRQKNFRVLNAYWHLRLFHMPWVAYYHRELCAQRLLASKIISCI